MDRAAGEARLIEWFATRRSMLRPVAQSVDADPEAVLDGADAVFRALLPTLPYVEEPNHPMAASAFECAAALAVFLSARELDDDLDVHRFGRAVLDATASAESEGAGPSFEELQAAGAASQVDAAPGEFVFDVMEGDGEVRRAIDITSCAICQMFAPHDAMDLVPYMCAMDDVVSDRFGQGLRRTGTIALGASHCDFRFTGRNGSPRPLSEQYPDEIQLD